MRCNSEIVLLYQGVVVYISSYHKQSNIGIRLVLDHHICDNSNCTDHNQKKRKIHIKVSPQKGGHLLPRPARLTKFAVAHVRQTCQPSGDINIVKSRINEELSRSM